MNDFRQTPDESELRAARRTAYALGELNASEAARVEAELAAQPGDQRDCQEVKRLSEELSAAHERASLPEASTSLRRCLLERLADSPRPIQSTKSRQRSAVRRTWWMALTAVAASVVYAVMFLPPPREQTIAKSEAVSGPSSVGQGGANGSRRVESVVRPAKVELEELSKFSGVHDEAATGVSGADGGVELILGSDLSTTDTTTPNLGPTSERSILSASGDQPDSGELVGGATYSRGGAGGQLPADFDLRDRLSSIRGGGTDMGGVSQQGRGTDGMEQGGGMGGMGADGGGMGGMDSSRGMANRSGARGGFGGGMGGGGAAWGAEQMGGMGGGQMPPASAASLGGYPGAGGGQAVDQYGGSRSGGQPATKPSQRLAGMHLSGGRRSKREGEAGGWRYYYAPEHRSDLRGREARAHAPTNPAVPGTEQYESLVENRFLRVADRPLSTFSIDVDSASYANVRRFLAQGQLPPQAAVRLEEMINYFSYDNPAPEGNEPFAASMEVAECPWTPGHRLVRIALKGKSVPKKKRPPCNLVFLLDVSGSMSDGNKLPLLKQAMKLLVDQLTENDRVAIVTYAGQAGLQLDSISGDQRQVIRRAIESLNASGSTNGSAGIQLAYQKAEQYFHKGGVNRVLLATDGDLNVGVTQDDALVELIKGKAKSGVFLTVLGFGQGNLQDAKLEKLADNGNGAYAYIDGLREARRVLVEQISANLVTIAQDVKVQVEFNPAQVQAYRLIGYENRLMTVPEFNDDRKDAGEIGAGHSVTVLYQVIPSNAPRSVAELANGLKYQRSREPADLPAAALTAAANSGELLTLFLRFKQPGGQESTLREFVLRDGARAFSSASQNFRFSSAVAAFGMLLRGSQFRGNATFAAVEEIASAALGDDAQGHRTEFLDLVRQAEQLSR